MSGCPFSLVSHPLWVQFFETIRPSFKVPNRQSIASKYVELHFATTESHCCEALTNSETLHLQLDGWSNIRNESIVNFIIITPKPIYVKSLKNKTNRHTAEYLANEIKIMLNLYGKNNFTSLIGDNAHNIQKAFRDVQEDYKHLVTLNCITHTLHILVSDILKNAGVAELISEVMEIINTCKNSQVSSAFLKEYSSKSLLLYSKTRWASIIQSLKSLASNRGALQRVAIDQTNITLKKEFRKKILDPDFWETLSSLIQIFEPIVSLITEIEGDNIFIHKVYAKVNELENKLRNAISAFSGETSELIIELFTSRKASIIRPIHYAAVILDPKDVGSSLTEEELLSGMEFISTLSDEYKKLFSNFI